jgi:hypothetical protein
LILVLEDALVKLELYNKYKVKRVNQHFGKEIQDYVYTTAFEYQQKDFHYFDINGVDSQPRTKKINFGRNDKYIEDFVINKFNI